jgi:nucleotide-binding universal stress UspA family protein/predicted Ser/Thr protein kinase
MGSAAAPLEAGAELDGFRIEERLHSGGMGHVYAVSRPGAPFPMVMKVPRIGHGEPASSIVTFEVEQMVLAALNGPHAPRFVAAGDLERQPYLVMERIDGRSLQDWVDGGLVAPPEVARLGAALATAVHALHAQEALHLDLKPANVLVRPTGEAVLIDFGLARHAHYPDLLAEEFRRPIGSAPYISPEQVLGVRDDPRSDVFSMGVILYELATGRLPFGMPKAGGLRRRLWRDPVPPRALVPDLPPSLQEVILRCLEPRASARYATAAQVAFDLSHPDQVTVGERGLRVRRAGPLAVMKRWVVAAGMEASPLVRPSAHLAGATIVMVAVATAHGDDAQLEALRRAVKRLLPEGGRTRVACVTVVRTASELGGARDEDTAANRHIRQLVVLRHWAEPMALPAQQLSFHVLESDDPADALLEYARANQVDHVVIGAPPRDVPLKGILGTVATKVAIEAPCSVTVVRASRAREAEKQDAADPGFPGSAA